MKNLFLRCVQTCRKAFMMCLGLGGRKAPEDEEAIGRDDETVDDNDNDEESDEEADAAGDEEDDGEDDEEEEEEDEERRPLFNGEFNRRLIAHGGRPYVLNAPPPVFGDDSDEESPTSTRRRRNAWLEARRLRRSRL
ncbi:MAG: hypothetical protein Q9193_002144 [Seirophora villosa]